MQPASKSQIPQHSHLGPSSAKRWINCAGSVAAIAAAPPSEVSYYAAEGTVAHSIAERLVTGKLTSETARDLIGETVMQDGHEVEIDDEMVESAEVYRDVIAADLALLTKPAPIIQKAETRVFAKSADSEIHGTADYFTYQRGNKLTVYDFKYGKGVAVSAVENEQGATYAIGVMDSEAGWVFNEVEIVIVQPRAPGEAVKRWTAPTMWFKEFAITLKNAAIATRLPNAPRVAGSWCRFCPAQADCPAVYEKAQKGAMVDFRSEPLVIPKGAGLPPVDHLPVETLAVALAHEDMVKSWFEAVSLRIKGLLESGQVVPGWKLVDGRSNRVWRDEAEVIAYFAPVVGGEDRLYKKKLVSPAQMEKLVGKKGKEAVDQFTEKPPAKKAIAPDSDSRPVARSSANDDFLKPAIADFFGDAGSSVEATVVKTGSEQAVIVKKIWA